MFTDKLRELKDERKLTNQQIADLSGVPLSTITRIFNGQTDNPNLQTISDIVRAMDGSFDELMGFSRKKGECSDMSDRLILLYQEMIRNKDKTIKVLFTCLCVIVGVIMLLLIYDIMNGNVGYVRY